MSTKATARYCRSRSAHDRLEPSWCARAHHPRLRQCKFLPVNEPETFTSHIRVVKGGWVYIVANRPNGVLYIGVTADIVRRVHQHRTGELEGFTKRYRVHRLVRFEWHDDIVVAIRREKDIKHWLRAWKDRLIRSASWNWDDLYETLL